MPELIQCLQSLSPKWKWRSHPIFVTLTIAIGQFSDNFLFGMRVPLIPVLVHDHLHITDPEENQRYTAIILASFSVAILITALPVGWIADFRFLRGYLYLIGLGTLMWSIVVFYTSESFAWMIASRGLNGFSAAVLYAAGYAMVADSVGAENLGKALGTIRSIVAVGDISGPPLGGIIFARWGFDGILKVSLGVLIIDLIMRLLMVDQPARESTSILSASSPSFLATHTSTIREEPGQHSHVNNTDETTPLVVTQTTTYRSRINNTTTYRSFSLKLPVGRGHFRIPLPSITAYLSDSQIIVCLFLSLAQYIMLGSYSSTLPLELELPPAPESNSVSSITTQGFGLDPSKVGLIYLALCVPNLLFAPIAGWAVDRFGPKKVAVTGYSLLVPSLAWMIIPTQTFFRFRPLSDSLDKDSGKTIRLALFCLGLIMQGFCMGIISTPAMVRAKKRIGELQRAQVVAVAARRRRGESLVASCDDDHHHHHPGESENAGGNGGEGDGFDFSQIYTGIMSTSASRIRVVKYPRVEEDSCEEEDDLVTVADSESEPEAVVGQLFGVNTMVYSFGLLVGNFSSAALRTSIGYGGMCLVWAGLHAAAATLAWVFLTDDEATEES